MGDVSTLSFHPASEAFPLMPPERFSELKSDIGARGQLEPITLCGGLILDGRNRYRACMELGIVPTTRELTGNPWAYVWSLNGQRRDLSQDQRAQIWIFVNVQSVEWEDERQRIADEANAKRSEKAKGNDNASKNHEKTVTVQSGPTLLDSHPSRKAAASVNPGAIARAGPSSPSAWTSVRGHLLFRLSA